MRSLEQTPASQATKNQPTGIWGRFAAAVAGRRTRWIALIVWLILVMIGGTFGSKIGSIQNNETQTWLPATAESTQALKISNEHFTGKDISTAVAVFARNSALTPGDRASIEAVRQQLQDQKVAVGPVSPVTVSNDKHAAFIAVPLRSSPSDNGVLGKAVDKVGDITHAAAPAGLEVRLTGQAGNVADYIDIFSGLDTTLLMVTIGIVAVMLLLTYRSPVLWLIPLMAVFLASQIAAGAVYLLARHAGLHVDGGSLSVLTVLTFGVGTDYALLLISRYREELRRHEHRIEAMSFALRRCLPAIAASAGTIVIATLCLLAGQMNSTRGLGPVAAIGVATAFAAMTTLLPALLVIFGRWVFWPRIPHHTVEAEKAALEQQHPFWASIGRFVARGPRLIWMGTAVVLIALAFGSTTLTSGQTQADQFTKKTESVLGQELLARHFPAGSSAPADIYTSSGQASEVRQAAQSVEGISEVMIVEQADDWTHLAATLTAQPDTEAARQTVQKLRAELEALPGDPAVVGGQSAVTLDTANARAAEEKLLIPVILAVVFVMLAWLLRAFVAPVVLLLSVVLSFAAAVGAASLLFHALGHPRIDRSLIIYGFLFLVALGIDYTIFLMTRAREEVQSRGHQAGILTGLTFTGGVITSAGLVLAATFSVLAVLPVVNSLQQGLLVAVGILLDTFLVRSLLVPALALDIGPKIWWPSRLGTNDEAKQPAGKEDQKRTS